jgi:hypothetical protein
MTVVSEVTGFRLGARDSITDRSCNFLLLSKSRSPLGPSYPPVKRTPGLKRPVREAGHHMYLVPRLRMRVALLVLRHRDSFEIFPSPLPTLILLSKS